MVFVNDAYQRSTSLSPVVCLRAEVLQKQQLSPSMLQGCELQQPQQRIFSQRRKRPDLGFATRNLERRNQESFLCN
jgi:hypothetical protein